ncbi:hypothetical protein CHX27_02945 [Flavobacterium aurantiibacter]|uniref:Uncharacterized protein n=1 Tax=Flavobacterium aurantiibacter TaxID=2023067 RepID=A0A256A124_9FLAO|nr:hypothetical protein CHX27_02945 [Flavobacterium aurantiibacter]
MKFKWLCGLWELSSSRKQYIYNETENNLKFQLKLKEVLAVSFINGICFFRTIIFDEFSYGTTLGFAL